MSTRNKEAAILTFFRSGPPEAVKLMFNLVKGAMKERFGVKKSVTGGKVRKSRTPKPKATEATTTSAA